MKLQKTTLKLGDKTLELEIGRFAQQANASVIARLGETVVHATIVMSQPREEIDYFPLFVEYQEKLYAGGKIKGSRWVKREGRPTDDVIITSRLIDRSIRPLFPEGFKNEVQIIVTVLSADGENDPDVLALFAVSLGLSISNIPWNGPIGAVRLGLQEDTKEFIINPTHQQREQSGLDLVISASKDAVIMLEAGANEISEADLLKAFQKAQETIVSSLKSLDSFIQKNKTEKIDFTPAVLDESLIKKVKKDSTGKIAKFVQAWAKLEKFAKGDLVESLFEKYAEKHSKKDIDKAIDYLMKQEVRRATLQDGARPDGRKNDQIRPLSSQVGLLPRTHGSAVFQRGSTQALTITTLGPPSLNQLIESMEGEENKRFIHHYYMPPFSVGETGRIGWPSRREIGHGALAERALEPMIPSEDDFPYTIHVVSELMSSNGSTSMASVCGSTLSLMDAGVPIKKPVSGIAMGLLENDGKYIILSDIQGLEDHTGDMDFKVAGTKDGITAMQMDTKISGIPLDVLNQALDQAKVGRLFILDSMLATLPTPRKNLSPHAPKIVIVTAPVDRIGEIIGPGGKMIKSIIAETGADVDVNDEGKVFISSSDSQAIKKAKDWIEGLLKEVEVGQEFDGKVTRIEPYGAFVEIGPNKTGLVHVSKMSTEYVQDVNTLVKLGDTAHVRVTEIDSEGKIRLTMLTHEQEEQKTSSLPPQSSSPRRGEYRGQQGSRDKNFSRDRRPPRRDY